MRKAYWLISAFVLTSAVPGISAAQAPAHMIAPQADVPYQGGDFQRVRVGNVMVTALSDGTMATDTYKYMIGSTPAKTNALLHKSFQTNPVEASINAYLIELPGRLVLVDTGVVDLFGPNIGGQVIPSLAAAGFKPEQITDILITHVHTDHSGGLTKAGKRLFPNATVHVGQPEIDFFLHPTAAQRSAYSPMFFEEAEMSLKPYVDAGKASGFSGTKQILPGITGTVLPGHTPGSALYTLTSGSESLTFVGDIVHIEAVQLPEPSITFIYDWNSKAAAANRLRALRTFARDRTLIAVPHFSFPGIGHIRTAGKGFARVPIPYTNRKAN